MNKQEQVKEIICKTINGDESSCNSTYCNKCSFRLPRLNEAAKQIIQLFQPSEQGEQCPRCKGIGEYGLNEGDICTKCGGSGKVTKPLVPAEGEIEQCFRCMGEGQVYADGKAHYPMSNTPTMACPDCGGSGQTVITPETVNAIGKAWWDKHSREGLTPKEVAENYSMELWESIAKAQAAHSKALYEQKEKLVWYILDEIAVKHSATHTGSKGSSCPICDRAIEAMNLLTKPTHDECKQIYQQRGK